MGTLAWTAAGGSGSSQDRVFVTVEKLPHVKRLVLTAWGADLAAHLELNRARLVVAGHSAVEILFDCHVAAHRQRQTPSEPLPGSVNLTCPITLDMKRDSDLDLPSASELKLNRRLLCRRCLKDVADLRSLERIFPLPSEYWMEMSELWVCDPHTMSTITQPYGLPDHRLDDEALPDSALVGIREIILPISALNKSRIDGGICSCSSCGHEIGEIVTGGVRVLKRCILGDDEGAGVDVFSYYTNASDIAARIFQHCQSRSRYMIEISCKEEECVLDLQICNWDSFAIHAVYRLSDGEISLESRKPSNPKRFAPVLKILFCLRSPTSPRQTVFERAKSVEELQIGKEEWEALVEALVQSNSFYPPSQRQLGGMHVGTLPRLSRIM